MGVILTVDIAFLAGGELLLVRRAKPPFIDRLVLPGGHVEETDASLAAAAARELREETGVVLRPEDLSPLCLLDAPDRDPRSGRRVSVVFAAFAAARSSIRAKAGSDARAIVWRRPEALRPDELGFDHWLAVQALNRRTQMKVIKEGKWNNPWSVEVVCPEPDCGATLLVEEKDVVAEGDRYYDCKGYYVLCPVCGKKVTVPAASVSPRVKRAAQDRRPSRYSSSDW